MQRRAVLTGLGTGALVAATGQGSDFVLQPNKIQADGIILGMKVHREDQMMDYQRLVFWTDSAVYYLDEALIKHKLDDLEGIVSVDSFQDQLVVAAGRGLYFYNI